VVIILSQLLFIGLGWRADFFRDSFSEYLVGLLYLIVLFGLFLKKNLKAAIEVLDGQYNG